MTKKIIEANDILELNKIRKDILTKKQKMFEYLTNSTFEEQKLLNKVKNDMKNLKRKEPLIVIHNLKEFERVNQVEDYIKNVLLRSSTFKLVEGTEINKDKEKVEVADGFKTNIDGAGPAFALILDIIVLYSYSNKNYHSNINFLKLKFKN